MRLFVHLGRVAMRPFETPLRETEQDDSRKDWAGEIFRAVRAYVPVVDAAVEQAARMPGAQE